MRAAVIEGEHLAALAAKQQHVLSEQPPAQQSAVNQLVIQGPNVPAILEEHVESPLWPHPDSVSDIIAPPAHACDSRSVKRFRRRAYKRSHTRSRWAAPEA